MVELMKIGWVFRIEIITEKVDTTIDIVKEISERLSESPLISQFLIEELYEDIKLKRQEKEAKT